MVMKTASHDTKNVEYKTNNPITLTPGYFRVPRVEFFETGLRALENLT